LKNTNQLEADDKSRVPTLTKRLVLFGGAKMPIEGINIFLNSLENGSILVIPWASMHESESFNSISYAFKCHKNVTVECSPLYDTMLYKNGAEKFFSQIKRAKGIFIGGGDQVRLFNIFNIPGIAQSVIAAHNQGIVFGGKSAGVACVSNPMISGVGDANQLMQSSLELVKGLGLLEGVLTDQHLLMRNRLQRLLTGLLLSEHKIGLGVDENSAVVVTNSCVVQAVGGNPAIIIVKQTQIDLRIFVLEKGQSFDFCSGERI